MPPMSRHRPRPSVISFVPLGLATLTEGSSRTTRNERKKRGIVFLVFRKRAPFATDASRAAVNNKSRPAKRSPTASRSDSAYSAHSAWSV